MARFFAKHGVPDNFWLGTSVTSQANANRVEELVGIPGANVKFVSAEPLWGEVSLDRWLGELQWVIAGGESLAGSRPSHPSWFRKLRDECVAQDVPFFLKQWGDWAPLAQLPATDAVTYRLLGNLPWHAFAPSRGEQDGQLVYRIGNDVAGASLDGREWRQMPQVLAPVG